MKLFFHENLYVQKAGFLHKSDAFLQGPFMYIYLSGFAKRYPQVSFDACSLLDHFFFL